MASTSHLSATTATIPGTTKDRAALIFKYFGGIDQSYESMKHVDATKQNIMRGKINTYKAEIVKLVNLDENIINQRNPDPNKCNKTIIMRAAERGYIDIINTLLNRGANINAKDSDGYTALMPAAIYLHLNVVELLLKAGANALLAAYTGETALKLIYDTYENNKLNNNQYKAKQKIIKLLKAAEETQHEVNRIYKHFNLLSNKNLTHEEVVPLKEVLATEVNSDKNIINQTIPGGRNITILMLAAVHGHTSIIKTLLKREANVNAKDRDGNTALKVASKKEIISLLTAAEEAQRKAIEYSEHKDDTLSTTTKNKLQEGDTSGSEFSSTTAEGSLNRLTPPQPRPFIISPKIIQQIKKNQKICNATFIIFFVFILISTPSYFYIRLKT